LIESISASSVKTYVIYWASRILIRMLVWMEGWNKDGQERYVGNCIRGI